MSGLLTPRRVRVAERVGFGLYVLVAVVLIGREVANNVVGGVTHTPSPTAITTVLPNTQASAATITTPPPPPPAAVTVTPTFSPPPTADPVTVTAYQSGGRHFAALVVPVGYTLTSPISGTASVVVYQFLGGDVRIGSNIPTEPFFPYITITSADRKVILRPGALGRDVQLVVKNGQSVVVGTPLFSTVGDGASSWRTFYDRTVTAQVIASVAALPSGAELDPVLFFKR